MKTNVVVGFVSVVVLSLTVGCSHNVAAPAVPSNQATNLAVEPSEVMEVRCVSNPDAFSKVGTAAGDAGRWSYNTLSHGFEWLTSQENKDRAEKVYAGAKDLTGKAYDAAVKEYHKRADTK